jgi:hypothetical protein
MVLGILQIGESDESKIAVCKDKEVNNNKCQSHPPQLIERGLDGDAPTDRLFTFFRVTALMSPPGAQVTCPFTVFLHSRDCE